MGADRALRDLLRPHLDATASSASAERHSPGSTAREGIAAAFEVGQYWSRTTQIDVVGLRDDNWTDLGECKWGPVLSS
jgi:uncharacterized protein